MFDHVIPKLKLQKMALFNLQDENGQSMVEMVIITPILIFLLIGVFEVGYAIRSYLVLANVSREITRFAIRPGYLDFATEESTADSYEKVRDWIDVTLSDQLDMDFDPNTGNATLIISHVVVDTGLPCEDISTNPGACNCDAFLTDPNYAKTFDLDDLIIHPNKAEMEFQAQRFGPATTSTGSKDTRINYDKLVVQELIPQNNKFNCELIKKSGLPSANNVIITELFLDQPQLFGFPVISNAFTDPVPLYAQTVMRLIRGTRSNGGTIGGIVANVNTLGPVCDAYPFVVHESTIAGKLNQRVDIFDGKGGSDFGWLAWNPAKSSGSAAAPYLRNELKYSTVALNDFVDARDPSDTTLSAGDYVASFDGVEATAESSDHLVSALIGKKIRIPVWDTFHAGTGGQRDAYHIPEFAWVRIESAGDINLPGKTVYATYLGDTTDSCPTSDSPVGNHSPLAMNDAATTNPDTPVTINVLNNDSDSDGDTLTITSASTPGHGSVAISGSSVTYTPNAGFSGSDSFTYTISDGNGGSDTATLTITINGGAALKRNIHNEQSN